MLALRQASEGLATTDSHKPRLAIGPRFVKEDAMMTRMIRRWIPVIVMLIVGTLCSTAFQAQDETTESLPGSQLRRPVNPKPFDKFKAPISGTIASILSDTGKVMFQNSPHPGIQTLLRMAGIKTTSTAAPAPLAIRRFPSPIPHAAFRQPEFPLGIAPRLSAVNTGCGTSSFGARFNLETAGGTKPLTFAVPQNEESIDAVVGGGISGDLVVEGANDYRGAFGPFGPLGGSLTGYYVHTNSTTSTTNPLCFPQFEGGAPVIFDAFGAPLYGMGDPVVAIDHTTRGSVYEADLRLNQDVTAITVVGTTTANLNNTAVCPNGTHSDAQASTCWPGGVVVNPLPFEILPDGLTPAYLNDKPHMTVDQRSAGTGAGNVYITGTEFDSFVNEFFEINSFSRIWLVSCTNNLSTCSSPTIVSGPDLDTQFSHVAVRPDGVVTVSYEEFDLANLAIDIRFVKCAPAAAPATPSCSPPTLVFSEPNGIGLGNELASNRFRIFTYAKHDHRLNGGNIETFMVWDRCRVPISSLSIFGVAFFACPKADVVMSESVNGGSFTTPPTPVDTAAKDQFFPWIKADPFGTVNIAYYTAEGDSFSHRIQVKLAQIIPGGTFPETVSGRTILTATPDDPAADPFESVLSESGFFGDYIGVVGVSNAGNTAHSAYVGFTYNVNSGLYGGFLHTEQNNYVSRFDY